MSTVPDLTRLKGLQCHNCNMRIYWHFGSDSWRHSYSQGHWCNPVPGDERVAHPRIQQ